MPYQNEYSQKQRFKHSYFKYRPTNEQSPERGVNINRVRYNLPEDGHMEQEIRREPEKKSNMAPYKEERVGRRREHSPGQTTVSILPEDRESPVEKERKKSQYAEELRKQMAENSNKRTKEKASKINQDYKYLSESVRADPFGRMGAGAPLRDAEGHVIANRIKLIDEIAVTSFHKSFYQPPPSAKDPSFYSKPSNMKQAKAEDFEEIGMQFLEWSNIEKHRKEVEREEWKRTLDEQTYKLKRQKEEEKRKKLEDDLRMEEKIKKDLMQMNEEFERETGKKSYRHNAQTSVGKESEVNFVVREKRKRGDDYKSKASSKEFNHDRK